MVNRNESWSGESPAVSVIRAIRATTLLIGAWLLVVASPMNASAVGSSAVYDATSPTTPYNVSSLGFQATRTSEVADYIHLGEGSRDLDSVTVTMSNWALYAPYASDERYSADSSTWTHPVTLNIYSDTLVSGEASDVLASVTQNISIPWRPVADPSCGTAWKADDGNCYNGIAFNATFDMSSLNVTLPDDIIVGVAYNTANYGTNPIGLAGPYNSLNVGIPESQSVLVGEDNDTDALFWNTTYPNYTAGLKNDTGWSPNGTIALKVSTTSSMPLSKDQCKNNGWKEYGGAFKNQGSCVSHVASGKSN